MDGQKLPLDWLIMYALLEKKSPFDGFKRATQHVYSFH